MIPLSNCLIICRCTILWYVDEFYSLDRDMIRHLLEDINNSLFLALFIYTIQWWFKLRILLYSGDFLKVVPSMVYWFGSRRPRIRKIYVESVRQGRCVILVNTLNKRFLRIRVQDEGLLEKINQTSPRVRSANKTRTNQTKTTTGPPKIVRRNVPLGPKWTRRWQKRLAEGLDSEVVGRSMRHKRPCTELTEKIGTKDTRSPFPYSHRC